MKRIEVAATPHEIKLITEIEKYAAVVIDALRATSTITMALHNGCSRILPVGTVDEASDLRRQKPSALLAGERKGKKLDGFDLGNSPQEYIPSVVAGREVILTTSNGTPMLVACRFASLIVVASYLNVGAVAECVNKTSLDVLIACAGHHGKLAAEDLACAGAIVAALTEKDDYYLTDGALAALALYNAWGHDLPELMRRSFSGKNIMGLGYESDIAYCAQVDKVRAVPVYRDNQITLL